MKQNEIRPVRIGVLLNINRLYNLIHHPEQYHGEVMSPPFFEGWYFKVVTQDCLNGFAFIPGISFSPVGEHHAFIQVLDGNTGKVEVKEYPIDQFHWDPQEFDIYIGKNHFNSHQMELDFTVSNSSFRGSLSFDSPMPWPKKFTSPGIMGPFGWMPFLECMHGVLSFDHKIHGALQVNGEVIDFENGRGYIEKDWGKSFPSQWIWMQSNHFSTPKTSFTFSRATIPFGLLKFTGVIAGLWLNHVLYPFTTYQGVSTRILEKKSDRTEILLRQGRYRLWVHAERETSGALKAPTTAGMNRRIMESLDAKLHVKLWVGKELLFDETGIRGGLEIVH